MNKQYIFIYEDAYDKLLCHERGCKEMTNNYTLHTPIISGVQFLARLYICPAHILQMKDLNELEIIEPNIS